MKTFAVVDEIGNIVYTVQPAVDDQYREGGALGPYKVHEIPKLFAEETPETLYWRGSFRKRPKRPGPHYRWNAEAESWEADLTAAVSDKKDAAQREYSRRSLLPITYDGKRLDADHTAQKNLSDKLLGVSERLRTGREMSTDLLVWKDADNVVHTWPELSIYHEWLSDYAIALEERNTRLYLRLWQIKDTLETLSSVQEVEAMDVTEGWPS